MKSPRDEDDIQFIASVDEAKTFYSLVVTCKHQMSDEEYADCLISFANDILEGQFRFDNNCGAAEILSQ